MNHTLLVALVALTASAAPPKLEITAPSAGGTPAADATAVTTVRREVASLQACYAESLGRGTSLVGPLTARLAIQRDGSATVRWLGLADPPPEPFTSCLTSAIARMRFDQPGPAAVIIRATPARPIEGTIGLGTIGTAGSSAGSGYGTGSRRASSGPGGGAPSREAGGPRPPHATVGHVSVGGTGEVDEFELRALLAQRLPLVARCVPDDLGGTIIAEFTLNTLGGTNDAWASGMKRADLETCVSDALRGIDLGTRSGQVKVKAAFIFRPLSSN